MSTCYLRSFDYKAYRKNGGKFSIVARLILMRSWLTHSEIQFSQRYYGASVSATMADKCGCVRFKWIGYSNAKKWWATRPIPLTDDQEDQMFSQALWDADVTHMQWDTWVAGGMNGCLFGDNALKYDILGVSVSFMLPKWRIWRPHKSWVWCSEQCKELMFVAMPWFKHLYKLGKVKRPDETTPSKLDHEAGLFIGDTQ